MCLSNNEKVIKMKIQTFSIIAGSSACNAPCPYCVSKMTPSQGIKQKEPNVNWRNFRIAANLAKQSGVTTSLITGKGEPTLFPDQIDKYMLELKPYNFPFIELQTNGILFSEQREKYDSHLTNWYENGMTTIAISIVHYDEEKNREIYMPNSKKYIDLAELTDYLHEKGFSVRLACTMSDNYICDSKSLEGLINFAQKNKVEQLTVRPVNKPEKCANKDVEKWTLEHYLKDEQKKEIKDYLDKNGHPVMTLQHGAVVYDVHGQNVCLTNSLTIESKSEDIRQLIFFPDGHLRYDWQYEGAILI